MYVCMYVCMYACMYVFTHICAADGGRRQSPDVQRLRAWQRQTLNVLHFLYEISSGAPLTNHRGAWGGGIPWGGGGPPPSASAAHIYT